MHVIIANYGNESVALIQWAFEQALNNVHIVSVETGWAAPEWPERVEAAHAWIKSLGFNVHRLTPDFSFQSLVADRGQFPSTKFQWCASFLKALPLLDWLDQHDSSCEATILLASRREMARRFAHLEEFISSSEHYGERRVWHPLYLCTQSERDKLIQKTPLSLLSHRSLECDPCVNSDTHDLARMSIYTIIRLAELENTIGQPMYHIPNLFPNSDIKEVVEWAKKQIDSLSPSLKTLPFDMGCGAPYGCGF